MSRKFIAAILAASLAVTGIAAGSARAADAKDVAKVLGTAAVVYMIGKAVSEARANARDDDDDKKRQTPQVQSRRADAAPHLPRPYRFEPSKRDRFDRRSEAGLRGVLPGACRREVRGARGDVLLRSCLRAAAVRTKALPDQCKSTVRLGKDREQAFSVRCLEQSGWRVVGRSAQRGAERNSAWNREWRQGGRHD